jgi:hypothetical protein
VRSHHLHLAVPVQGRNGALSYLEKCRKTLSGRSKDETGEEEAEEYISDSDLDKIIGTSENSELQVCSGAV